MRIISGKFKSTILKAPEGQRPSTERLREALFSSLQSRLSLDGKSVLDLYSGSGSLGIEAISRGASFVCFVDNSDSSIDCLKENLAKLSFEKFKIIKSGTEEFLLESKKREFQNKFSLVLSDPPYDHDPKEKIISWLVKSKMLEGNAIIVLEGRNSSKSSGSNSKRTLYETNDNLPDSIEFIKKNEYGDSQIQFFQYSEKDSVNIKTQ